MQELGSVVAMLANSECPPGCVIIDTTKSTRLDHDQLAAASTDQARNMPAGNLPVAVVARDERIREALRRAGIAPIMVTETIKQAIEACGESRTPTIGPGLR